MARKRKTSNDHCAIEKPEGFFRDVEIEFLIHELKDPLAVIETNLRTLLEKKEKFGQLTLKQERSLKRALRNSGKARAMLHSLLEVGRSEAGCFICCAFHPVQVVYAVLLEAMEIMLHGVSAEFNIVEDENAALRYLNQNGIALSFPSDMKDVEMVQDEIKFRQIVGNLIKNALHHRKNRIELNLDMQTDRIILDVRDDGVGIDPAHRETVFERYRQVDTCSLHPRRGHGLGLAGARIMARCLGGEIELLNQMGKGSTFRLFLPVVLKSEAD